MRATFTQPLDASVEDLLPIEDVSDADSKLFLEADATANQLVDDHQLPSGFFDDTQDHSHASVACDARPLLSARYRLGTFASSLLRPRPNALFDRVSYLFHPSQPNPNELTEVFRPISLPPPISISPALWRIRACRAEPPIVDVPFAQGKERNAAAGAPKGNGGYRRGEDFDPPTPPSSLNPNSRQPSATVQTTISECMEGTGCVVARTVSRIFSVNCCHSHPMNTADVSCLYEHASASLLAGEPIATLYILEG
ncbi:hypothetical protein K503DRAFT_802202 [Rhizopogon vinicolor AM-OR11-026]|uniref:Uncharacterized protein n=1 Tax=Rhizopogon vinicolor AM-OR11-026 TaxID=1314800 RepID=A0A1B7MUE6_9AGAM|nr:hypothetical protein K503DRAFT_802202 [Rhizopogon vinicolor AM-OR11-026]